MYLIFYIYLYFINGKKLKSIKIFLFSLNIHEIQEFEIPNNIKRFFLKDYNINNLILKIKKKKIEILIYQFPHFNDINLLNRLKKTTTIFYQHSSLFYWIHNDINMIKITYKEYINSKYIVNLIPIENDFIFKKWGINSILMNNFITYEYQKISPSNLSSKIILMVGRADDIYKRFELGLQAMEYIIMEIPEGEMKIISGIENTGFLQNTMHDLHLENHIKFVGFSIFPEIYFKNASLHIFPTLTEAFPMALCETKIYGIPNILLGLDYVSLSKGGTIIIYDEMPESLAKESIKILNNLKYRKKLGKEARLSMRKFNNKLLVKKWIKLILSVYNGEIYYQNLRNKDLKLNTKEALNILQRQLELIKKRRPFYINTTIKDFLNFTYLLNFDKFNYYLNDLDDLDE